VTQADVGEKKTVLVIEDDEDCRFVYGEFLRHAGFEAVEAADGRQAEEYLAAHSAPNLIILDLTLPNTDAKEFVSRIRSKPDGSKTPILVLSGRHDIEARAREIGAEGFVKKPCDLMPLTRAVVALAGPTASSDEFLGSSAG
jgi:DNA-binding response OmpR family regulator